MHTNNLALASGFPDHDNASELAYTLTTMDATTIQDIRTADCIICIGTNLFDSHPVLGLEILHALNTHRPYSGKGASLITIDARQTRLADEADVWLQPRIATDHVLLAGVGQALVDKGEPPQ